MHLVEKKRIGMIVAIETEAIAGFYGKCEELDAPAGFQLLRTERTGYEMYILKVGMGEINAAAGVQFLITACGVGRIVNFGVVGGLTAEMRMHKICVVDRVVHYKYDLSECMDLKTGQVYGHDSIYIQTDSHLIKAALEADSSLVVATCCSGDKFVASPEEKTYLHETFGGDICDMESAGIVLACEMNNVPCILFKAVADGLQDGADGFYNELLNASLKCLKVANSVMEEWKD